MRKPAWNEGPVAATTSPVVRYLRRGERVTSCVVAVGRDAWSHYSDCGGGLWRVVPGGQAPARCPKYRGVVTAHCDTVDGHRAYKLGLYPRPDRAPCGWYWWDATKMTWRDYCRSPG
ncbi:hypothetical protein [Streptomyces sasae]|uniref:hypothetical protein n=1 Tax=Streptomyces sasae TaxID=1266772 RepID=UPI00292D9E57|nr:hypothetical protein [Streptomyces sasae]